MSDHALFTVTPLASFVLLVAGATFRLTYETAPGRGSPQPTVESPRWTSWGWLLVIAILGIAIGHLVMIVWPNQLVSWSRDMRRLVTIECVLLTCGAVGLVGVGFAVRRAVLQQRAGGGNLPAAAFLGILLLTVTSGLGIAIFHRWAPVWSAASVTPYVRTLLIFQPNPDSIQSMPYLVRLHVFSSFLAVALVAFTGAVDTPLNTLLRAVHMVVGPVVTVCDRSTRAALKWTLGSLRRFIWPEDEEGD